MGEWLPIESAPIPIGEWCSSDIFLVWNGESVVPCVAWTMKSEVRFNDYSACDRDGDYSEVMPAPTHWMPLPQPPVS